MPKRKPNEEIVIDGENEIVFTADYGFLAAVNSYGKDVSIIYSELNQGLMNPVDIRNILHSGLPRDNKEKMVFIEGLISKHGLQQCSIVAFSLMVYGMIGDAKKSAIERREEIEEALTILTGSPSKSLKKVGYLWVAQLTILTLLACSIFKLSGLCTV